VMRLSVKLHKRYGLRLVYVAGCCVYAIGFLSWGLVSSPRLVATFTVFEGTAFALIFTTAVVIVGRLVPPRLYSTGNSIAAMVAFGIGPIIGAGAGGFVFQYLGAGVLFGGAAILALSAGAVAWFALAIPRLSEPGSANASPIA
jgi:MFS family permease